MNIKRLLLSYIAIYCCIITDIVAMPVAYMEATIGSEYQKYVGGSSESLTDTSGLFGLSPLNIHASFYSKKVLSFLFKYKSRAASHETKKLLDFGFNATSDEKGSSVRAMDIEFAVGKTFAIEHENNNAPSYVTIGCLMDWYRVNTEAYKATTMANAYKYTYVLASIGLFMEGRGNFSETTSIVASIDVSGSYLSNIACRAGKGEATDKPYAVAINSESITPTSFRVGGAIELLYSLNKEWYLGMNGTCKYSLLRSTDSKMEMKGTLPSEMTCGVTLVIGYKFIV